MSVTLNVNNTDYFYPEQGDINWGAEATDWAVAVTSGMLQKAGGLFQLLGEVDFGPNYGLKSLYYKSRSSNVASAGILRLANGDTINFRNYLNTSDLPLGVNSLNQITFNGQTLAQDDSVINVMSYGAVGNGVTVDSTAIQAAIDAAEASVYKKIVYFPNTTLGYVIDTPIVVPAGVTLLGDNYKGGERSRIKPQAGYNGHLIESKGFNTPVKQDRINIVGLFLDGSSTTLTAVALYTQESAIVNTTIKNCVTYGIWIGGISSTLTGLALNNIIQNCYLSGFNTTSFFDGIRLDYYCADNTITTTYIEQCTGSCIRSRSANDIIENNHLYNANTLYYSETSDDKMFVGNYLENSDDAAVYIKEGSGGNLVLNGTISNNVLRNINRDDTADGLIEIIGPNTTSLVVSGNVVRRDSATTYNADYFVFFDSSALALINSNNTKIYGNTWQSSCVTIGETNSPKTFLDKLGGSFELESEYDLGSTYGLKLPYITSSSSNPASAGIIRLSNSDVVVWRNALNSGDLNLSVDSSNRLSWNGTILPQTITDTSTIDLTLSSGQLSAAIITGSIDNSLISNSAAIALSKLATLTASRVLVSDGSGFVSASSVTTTTLGYLDATSSIQTQLNSLSTSKANLSGATFTGAITAPSVSTPILNIDEGTNARMGLATLVGGTVTVNTTAVTTNSRIFLTSQVDGGTPGFLRVSGRSASTSFTITSSSATDTSQVAWLIVEPH